MRDKEAMFMSMAYLIAMSSKDPRTKVGAVIVGPNNEVRSTGYNGMPRGAYDEDTSRHDAPEKYFWFEHAERNAIYNAARMGTALEGCIMYVSLFPCMDCARAIIQAGITKIVVHKGAELAVIDKWDENHKRSKILLAECGVEVVEWEGNLVKAERCLSGTKTSAE